MEFEYIDIHSHLNLKPLSEDRQGVLKRMQEKKVATITIGVDYDTSLEALSIAKEQSFIWAGVGLHPTDNTAEVFDFEKYKKLASDKKVVCIGECGLDYYRDWKEETKKRQKEIFKKHIELAIELEKPLMIHARPSKDSMNAYSDALDILEEYKKTNSNLTANFHFFVGDIFVAKRILNLGFTVSFDGPITFAREYDDVIRFLPIESIMSETDAPFAAPAPHRGKTCEPFMVEEIVKKIAEIKEISLEEVKIELVKNAKRVFKI